MVCEASRPRSGSAFADVISTSLGYVCAFMTSLEKGNRLEQAVRRIETSIIQSVPGYSEAKFQIESKKIITVAGVRHEFDLWVKAQIAAGYESNFVFECRNREEKASKNDIIVFAEKVKVANAAKGFFIAKSFTQDALAQVALDGRLIALVAEEIDPASIEFQFLPLRPHFREEELFVGVFISGKRLNVFSMELPLDIRGEQMTVGKFIRKWIGECKNLLPVMGWPSGEYPYAIESTIEFRRWEAFLAGMDLTELSVIFSGVVEVERAVVVSAFDVESRGRTIGYEFRGPVMFGDVMVNLSEIHTTLVPAQ